MAKLTGKRVAILVDNYFEEAEFTGPLESLKKEGAQVDIVAPKVGTIHAMNHTKISDSYQADRSIDDIRLDEYDALVLPGGAVNADCLRMNNKARLWVRRFLDLGKPVAAICHAPWLLASSNMARGRKLTSYFTIQDDMRNAGADWVDEEVVVDDNLITSRNPGDVPAFSQAIITKLQTA
ncbi:MAG: glutamine amidotransferase [Candidatus Saccharibacteria bacterium]|nr:glutamine amidotransferase [Candidatus Saccharibacteria bacterium]